MPLALPSHLSFCEVDGRPIFLDRRSGRYFLLAPALNQTFNELIRDPTVSLGDHHRQQLLEGGIVIAGRGAPLRPAAYARAVTTVLDQVLPTARLFDVAWLLIQEANARRALRRGGLDDRLTELNSLRPQAPPSPARCLGLIAASEATRRYRSVYDQCLPRSLVLTHALRQRGAQARLILGVTGSPFAAHAWVQEDGCVLNDRVDQVGLFTPILVV